LLFSSNVFLFAYLPCVLAVYYLLPRWLRNPFLLLASLLFYGWGEPVYLLLMVVTIGLNYLFGAWIHHRRSRGRDARGVLVISVAVNLLLLGYFKYMGFLMETVKDLIPALSDLQVPQITLPIGISFYIFQSMSYVIDVYRDDAPVQKNPLTFGTYIALFPQLIAGPIVRYIDVAEQMDHRRENLSDFAAGVMLFVVGLAKKVLLANSMGALWDMLVSQQGTLVSWVGIVAYSFQIYFDFSGYSDMARGLGRMLGFRFLENFNYPYISRSVTEFWRRWHISLSTWFREYVYIPLGGNRKGLPRQILNLLIVWLLTGFWHGASWNFVLWGLYYALWLIAEKVFLLNLLEKLPKPVRHIYTLVIVVLGWALFYFEDMGALGSFLGRLFRFVPSSREGLNLVSAYLPLLCAAAIASVPAGSYLLKRWENRPAVRVLRILAAGAALMLCVAALASQSYNPFIYFRF